MQKPTDNIKAGLTQKSANAMCNATHIPKIWFYIKDNFTWGRLKKTFNQ